MNDAQIVLVLLILWALISIFFFIKNTRKYNIKFALKRELNTWKAWLGLLIATYILLFGVALLPSVTGIFDKLHSDSQLLLWIVRFAPLAFMVMVLWAYFKVYIWGMTGRWIPYTEQEKAWLKDENDKWYARYPKWLQKFIGYKKEAIK